MNRLAWTAAALTFALAACGSPETPQDAAEGPTTAPATGAPAPAVGATMRAVAQLRTANGESAGTATASPVDGQTMITLNVEGLPPGPHGVHVHMTGRCDPPTFASAGGHWNPSGAQHGLENPQGQHAGDMPNLTVGADGRGALEHRLEGAFDGLLDADGSAFVVHASADDQRTDPSGDSGDRIACGVFERG
jgi:Cu-Zn family superoxide dismutase